VLAFACGIFAVLGSFWGVVWFIRAYVEAPRVNIPPPIQLASSESRPVALPKVEGSGTERAPAAPIREAQAKPAPATPQSPSAAAPREPQASAADAVADRWAPMNQFGAPPPAAPAPAVRAEPPATPEPAAIAAPPEDTEPPIEEVAEGSVPAIAGPAPLPRRKPTMTAAVRRVETTPLPRPRPDGPAPQSVWTGVPSADERFVGHICSSP
jgi:hypothetical protein